MRIVVTRPEASAQATADRLRALGHQPALLPLTKPVHHPDVAKNALRQHHGALAVTSAEAVRVLSTIEAHIAPHLGDMLFAVGAATARAAEAAGFRNIVVGNGTGVMLAELIAGRKSDFSPPLLYLAGKPRSPRFEQGLAKHAVPCVTVEIYEMYPVPHADEAVSHVLRGPSADVVLLYSRENARLFFELAAPHMDALAATRILCLSANVAEAVPNEFAKNIKIAAELEEEALFTLL